MYHEKLLESIIEKISECKNEIHAIRNNQSEELQQACENENYDFGYSMENHSYHFSRDVGKKWKDLVNHISKKIFNNQFSLTYIDKGLRKYFHNSYEEYNSENLTTFFTELKDSASDLLFCIPIYGISLSNQELDIGNFSFKTRDKIKAEISELSPQLHLDMIIDLQIQDPNQVLLINKHQTDSEKALEITLNQTNRLIDILNWKFSQLPQLFDTTKYIISLLPNKYDQLKYFDINNKQTISARFKNLFSTLPLDLNDDSINSYIFNDEVLWLIELIFKEKTNDYHDAILKSLHWFSQFWIEKQSDNQLLYLAISLEALLSEAFATSSFVSDRVAFILGEDKSSRLELRDLSKKLYDLRSDIAHGNNINVVREEDLSQLEAITREVIQYALNNRDTFNSLKDFKKSIDNKKYE